MTGFFDGGAKSMSFGKVRSPEAQAVLGRWRGGPIINIGQPKQQTDWETRELKFWPKSQDPIMQLPITLDTARGKCPEPAIDGEDDLVRDWYITKGRQDFQALRSAMRAAGVNDIEVGGELYGRWVSGVGEKGDPRIFEFHYTPPVQSSSGFMDDGPGDQPAPTPAMPPQVPPTGGAVDPTNGQPLAPPQPVWNAATGAWEIPQAAPAAPPAAPPPPPQPVFNQATGQWEIPGAPAPASPPPQPAAPAANGWSPGSQAGPGGPGPQASNQPAGNPFKR